jgi:signal transduction histidine kinase
VRRASLPETERERVAELVASGLLDSDPEPAFDELVELAREFFGVPIALVSLVDSTRQWFKARAGLDARQTGRDEAFCAHAILGTEPFVVRDALADERFSDNPLVVGDPGVRFYAGAPLLTPSGNALGTLCIIDRRPRELSARETAALSVLARQVAMHVNLRLEAAKLKQANERLATSEQRHRALIEALPDALIRLRDGVIVDAVEPRGFFPVRPVSNYIGRLLCEQVPPALTALFEGALARVEREGGPVVIEYTIDSQGLSHHREARLVRVAAGEALCIVRDVSERREIDRLKNEFVSTVSHELRTPLTAIRGALGLLEGGALGSLPPEALEMVVIGRVSCDRLVRLVNDLLDVEKLKAGRLDLVHREVAPRTLLRTAFEGMSPLAAERGISLEEQLDDALPAVVVDPDRVVQVLTNLLSNAIKFSPAGGRVAAGIEQFDGNQLRFSVSDQGPGIDESQLGLLFRRFQQLDAADAREKGGTGLGLAISKALVELQGGQIGVESEPGRGSRFWFTLPSVPPRRS